MEKKYSEDYSIKELLACFISRDIEDGECVGVGANQPVPRAGVLLAHLHHGPNMLVYVSMTETNLFHEPVLESFESNTDWRAAQWAEYYRIHDVGFDDLKARRKWIFVVGGLQIDRYGNTNLVGIGKDYKRLKFRGPGLLGIATLTLYVKRYYIFTNTHDKKVFVDQCDYISCYGWGKGGDERQSLGLYGEGPRYCITPLCIMDFEEETKRMRLKSVHPGVSVEQVIENTEFELFVPKEVPITPPPTGEEIQILRTRIDVDGALRKK